MTDYQNQDQATQEAMRNPKNRFLFLFCHANDVGDSWGLNWPFYVGVIIFSILVGIMTFFDLYYMIKEDYFRNEDVHGWFTFMFILRLISDGFAVVSIIFGFKSVCQALESLSGAVAYYAILISLLLNTIFCVYCIIRVFSATFWGIIKWRIITFFLQEPVLFAFAWILFGNMVEVARKIRSANENA